MTDSTELAKVPTSTGLPAEAGLSIYEGAGIRALRVEQSHGRDTSAVLQLEEGRVFGGDLAEAQEWTILHGIGLLSWDSPFRRVRVQSGQTYRMEAGDRPLLKAETRLWLQLSRTTAVSG